MTVFKGLGSNRSTIRNRLSPPLVALLAANATPIVGVLLFGWDVFSVLLLFWIENVTIGAVNVLKMLSAKPADPVTWIGKLFFIPFFCVHYGLFCAVHGMLLVSLFGRAAMPGGLSVPALVRYASAAALWGPIGSLVASHLFSFAWNFLWLGENQRAGLSDLMGQPYARVIVLHVTLLAGGFLMLAANSPAVGLIVLVAIKTALDVRAHVKERVKFGRRDEIPAAI